MELHFLMIIHRYLYETKVREHFTTIEDSKIPQCPLSDFHFYSVAGVEICAKKNR